MGKAPSRKIKAREVSKVQNKVENCLMPFMPNVISPITDVEASFIFEPFYYTKHSKPRKNVTLAFDRTIEVENAFIEWVDEMCTKESAPPKIWLGREKIHMIKFQTPEDVIVYRYDSKNNELKKTELTEEIGRGEFVQVKFDIFKYYDRNKKLYAFNFKPSEIYIYTNKNEDHFNVNYTDRGN